MSESSQQTHPGQEESSLTPEAALSLLVGRVKSLMEGSGSRIAVGLTGGPGVGKSTLATQIVESLNATRPDSAVFVPMDGFHMRHAKLETLGTVKDKGAPHTFEGAEFAKFLKSLKVADKPVSGPGYSRKIEDVVDDAFTVAPEARILVTEGNYLLLGQPPWDAVKSLLDLAVFINVPRETVRDRLMKRHAEEGLFTEERNREHVARVDLPNYDLVVASKHRAHLVINLITEG
jgi:pantothenate kinase